MHKIINCNDVSREALQSYMELLFQWNKKINLVSRKIDVILLETYIADCLQLMRFIPNKNITLVDVGSGNGLPGLILSIAGVRNVILVEQNAKKCSFLLRAAQISSNTIEVINEKAENISVACDIVTARAFASLETMLARIRRFVVRDKCLFFKGTSYNHEISKLRSVDIIVHDNIIYKDNKILEINKWVQ